MKSLHFQKTNIQFIFSMLTLLESRELQLNSINVFQTCTNIPQIERERVAGYLAGAGFYLVFRRIFINLSVCWSNQSLSCQLCIL